MAMDMAGNHPGRRPFLLGPYVRLEDRAYGLCHFNYVNMDKTRFW